ncbi:glycosyl hydrolase catalytic core-domain-containing protein [Immersiella caudata]|uniref:Glycosyl hydrolase catalytic core-domain-containing protein n=1 Tax=Immersiella caudata TaxID=314043 RepID=A0AA39WE94_9PEZI|nr:glycosyl hydrolase catalytic core-domain-containing protein [Immersiella caudata]
MLTKILLALAAASVIKDVVALGPRQHHHQRLHEKRAIVTEVVTVTDVVYVTLYEDQATSSSAFSAKQFYTKKGRKSRSSAAVATATPSPVLSLEALPRPSAPVEAHAPPAPTPTVEAPVAEPAPVSPPAVDPVPVEPATPVTPPSGGAPAGKRGRGLAFNDPNLLGRFLGGGSHISWTYNWAQTDDSNTGLEFVPMCWGITKGFPATWAKNAQKMIDAGSKALFSFNEPDHAAQANLSPEQAAASHIELMNPFAGKARIGAPSITNSGSSNQGIGWLKRWFEVCDGKCAVDFVNIHIYGFDTNTFLQHLINVHNLFQKPVWITEFAFGGSDDEVDRQLQVIIDQIENNSTFAFVENYSYFMAADGMMVKGNSMSSYGNTFAYAS